MTAGGGGSAPKQGAGSCKVFNRTFLADIVADGQMDEGMAPLPEERKHREIEDKPAPGRTKHREILGRVHEQRRKDQATIKKNVERNKEVRERRFERLLQGCIGSDEVRLRGQVTEMLRQQHNMNARKVGIQFQSWNEKVFESVQGQLDAIMNPPSRELIQTFTGMKNVEFELPDVKKRVKSSSFRVNPTYKDLVKNADENAFRYAMDLATESAERSTKNGMDSAISEYTGSAAGGGARVVAGEGGFPVPPGAGRMPPRGMGLSIGPSVNSYGAAVGGASSSSSNLLAADKEKQAMYTEALHSGIDTKLLQKGHLNLAPGMEGAPVVPKFAEEHRVIPPVSLDLSYRSMNNFPKYPEPSLTAIHGIDYDPHLHYLDLLDPNKLGYNSDDPRQPSDPLLARTRPVLEPHLWEQLRIQATPYGHFAQVCAQGPDYQKTRNFVPDETDCVPAAGKRKTRFTRDDVGILKGEIRDRGESSQHKNTFGASSAAPNQDHYTYEKGTRVVDNEFPLGKMMLPHKH
ncbi:unnamed protein product [Amoebophrya sp. A25]|nr:unnamed protein product [Amoebophrya sp. A25]|eukprot:GSA25T00012386001.1